MAALLVVMFHYSEAFAALQQQGQGQYPSLLTQGTMVIFGGIGVPIFFVVSGFVMGLQKDKPSGGAVYSFLAKRVARIVPLYWTISILLVAFIFATTGTADFGQLFLSMGFMATWFGLTTTIGPGWTLEYEMLFYVAFALLVVSNVLGSKRTGEIVLSCIYVALVLGGLFVGGPILRFAGHPIILWFCAGMLISQIYLTPWIMALSRLWLVLGFAAAAFSATQFNSSFLEIVIFWGVSGFFLVLGLSTEETKGRTHLRARPFQVLGNSSYAIYLLHLPLEIVCFPYILWTWHLHQLVDPNLALVLLMLIPIIVGIAVHYLYENPINGLVLNLLLGKRSAREPAPVAVGAE